MHRRLFASLAGAVVGLAAGAQVASKFDLAPAVALAGCAAAGIAIGYVASMLFDVFAGRTGVDQPDSSE